MWDLGYRISELRIDESEIPQSDIRNPK